MNYAEALCLFFKYLWVVFFFQISFCYKRVIVRQQVVVVWSLSHVRLFCDSINCSLPGSSVHGISKATVLEWVPFPSPRDLPCPEIEPVSSAWQEDSLALSHLGSPLRQHTSYNFSSQFIVWWAGLCSLPIVWPEAKLLTHASTGDSWTLTGKSGSVSCRDTAPFSWLLVCTRFCLCPPRVCFPSPLKILGQGLPLRLIW